MNNDGTSGDSQMETSLKYIIESLLFVADDPVPMDRLKNVLECDAGSIRKAMGELSEEYESRGGAFYLKEVAGGFQLRTRPEFGEWIKRFKQPSPVRLSKAALETLAIIAYKQPVIRSDIENIRGVDSGGILRTLLERRLIRILGRKEIPGRPIIYATTKYFLELFDLKDLKELPSPKEIEELGGATDENAESEPESDPIDPPSEETETENPAVESDGDTADGNDAEETESDGPEPGSNPPEDDLRKNA